MDLPKKKLGFGLMRLPKKDDEIILDETIDMVDAFMDAGFTYFDTAFVYQGSEPVMKKAITERYPRDRFTAASKMAAWKITPTFSAYDMFNTSLERTGLDYFDYYLLHSLQDTHMEECNRNGCWDAVKKLKEEGKIRHLGFSFHGRPELLRQIFEEHSEMEFVQLQVNYLDMDSPFVEAKTNLEIAREFGKPVIVMEPVKGGLLSSVSKDLLPEGISAADLALRFAGNLEGVMAVLSGMSSLKQVQENIATFSPLRPLSEEDKKAIDAVRKHYSSGNVIQCTACRYCTAGCPKHIDIPLVFRAVNDLRTIGEHGRPRNYYKDLVDAGRIGRASDCIKCRKCESVCPQHLPITDLLKECSAILDEGKEV